MFELRWLIKPTPMGEFRKLQYRYRAPKITDDVGSYPPTDWTWSEWADVPGVKEADEANQDPRR